MLLKLYNLSLFTNVKTETANLALSINRHDVMIRFASPNKRELLTVACVKFANKKGLLNPTNLFCKSISYTKQTTGH